MRSTTSFLFLLTLVKAHGDHSFDLSDEDIGMSYAERHVRLPLLSPSPLLSSHIHSIIRPCQLLGDARRGRAADTRCTQNTT